MTSFEQFTTHGKIIAAADGFVVFHPRGTNYELQLKTAKPFTGQLNTPVEGVIRATARKVWTVPSGGNFITPIMGPSRIVQGRVRQVDASVVVVQAGGLFVVELPGADTAIDLACGQIVSGGLVNATLMPGASFELMSKPAAAPVASGV